MRILIADDDRPSLYVLRQLLSAKHQIHEAMSPDEAVNVLAQHHDFDLILTDFSLSGDDGGLQVLNYVRNSQVHYLVPVVCVTAHALRGDRERFLRLGFDEYLEKPISQETVEAMVAMFKRTPF